MKHSKTILIVDDESSMRKNLVDFLSLDGYNLIEASDGEEALGKLKLLKSDVVLLDINLPKKDGLSVLSEMKEMIPDLPVIIFTAYGTSERAIEAMKSGAFDYLEKPFELDELQLLINRALEFSDLLGEVRELRSQVSSINLFSGSDKLIGRSSRMQEIFKLIGRVSPTDAAVLVQGESGTGKELIADAIQRHSLRRDKPYIKVNCGAFSETLLESEIFGHEKGAFTGAITQRQGRFELANSGTIFLDEINNMPASLQIRLLRVLQNQSFYRVGGEQAIKVDVRVIAASNKNVEEEVETGNIRKDLFYRLNVVRINVPPLRERAEDIPLLVEHFIRKFNPEGALAVPNETIQKLRTYSWPGNVRELENTIQSAVVMARENIITIDHLPVKPDKDYYISTLNEFIKSGKSFKSIISEVEKQLILNALKHSNWNRTQAAKFLKIHRRFLYSKMKEHGIDGPKTINQQDNIFPVHN